MSSPIVQAAETKMQGTVEALKTQLTRLHTGRANPALIEDLQVEYFGNRVPLKQIANVSVPEPRQLMVQPWDQGAVMPIEKAITTSNLGFTPRVEGRTLRVILPEVTEDRRKQLKKIIEEDAEKSRVQIRSHRQDAIKAIRDQQQAKAISEDDSRRLQEEVQKKTELMNAKILEVETARIKDVMSV